MEENTQVKKRRRGNPRKRTEGRKEEMDEICQDRIFTAGCCFSGSLFYKNYDSYKNLDVEINWLVFTGAVLFYFLYKVTLASLWHYITKLNHCSIKYFKAITAYLYSILGKYIPGKVFMLLARVPAYEEGGAPIRKVTVCFFP